MYDFFIQKESISLTLLFMTFHEYIILHSFHFRNKHFISKEIIYHSLQVLPNKIVEIHPCKLYINDRGRKYGCIQEQYYYWRLFLFLNNIWIKRLLDFYKKNIEILFTNFVLFYRKKNTISPWKNEEFYMKFHHMLFDQHKK